MKSQEAIFRRVRKLRLRYAKKHVKVSQARCHGNCRYNFEHAPSMEGRDSDVVELALAPREVTTTLVLRDDQVVHLCMYGAEDAASWLGDMCDSDDVAERCKWFDPRKSAEEARGEFMKLLADEEWVYENHRDLAALQWALDGRRKVSRRFLSFWERFLLWLVVRLSFMRKPGLALPPFEDIGEDDLRNGKCDEELNGVWDDDPPEDPGA